MSRKVCFRRAVTIMELVIAMVMIGIIFAAILPQFAIIRDSWDVKQGIAESLQNGRVLVDHIDRNLSKAVKITAVSNSSVTNGYIQFISDVNDSNTYRYDIGANNYIEYGSVGNLADLAGPVGLLKFTCYDACNLDTPLSPVTDVNIIRVVKVDATITNSASMGQNKTFTTWVYLRTNADNGGVVGCWRLDETSGTTAVDLSGNGNNGTLVNMTSPSCWVAGQIGNALVFDGTDDYVNLGAGSSLNFGSSAPFTVAAWVKTTDNYGSIVSFRSSTDDGVVVDLTVGYDGGADDAGKAMILVRQNGGGGYAHVKGGSVKDGLWHHVVAVRGSGSTIELFLDGVSQGTSSGSESGGAITADWRAIGSERRWVNVGFGTADQRYLVGTIDDVRIYKRALSAVEIADMANLLRYRDFREYKAGYFLTEAHIATPPSNAGDLLIAAVATYGDTSSSLSGPAGWTLIDRGENGAAVTLGVWYKIAGASEPGDNRFTWTGSRQAYGWIMRFTGQDAANPINASYMDGQKSITPTSPAVNATVNGCLILRVGAFNGDDIVVDYPGLPGHIAITMDESCDTNRPITYGGFSEAKLSYNGTSITVAPPAGTVAGDFLIAAVAAHGSTYNASNINTLVPSPSTGWTTLNTLPGGYPISTVTLSAWSRLVGASEPAYTFTWTGGRQAYAWIVRLTGTSFSNGSYPNPKYSDTPSSSPLCNATVVGPPGVANVITIRLGAFDGGAINIDSPGLPDHNVITMDRSSAGVGSVSGGAGYQYGAGTTSNFSLTAPKAYWTASPCVYPPGAYSNSCSGGAGYVRQAAAGSSGTSTFALGSSKDAMMMTIAIAPASTSIHGCCGDPRP